ncbi:sporulation protein [Oceanobacillus bengalensis]|uniref:Sporulation protein SpoOM n=1 Tax=Oceanobacillus bengalensis TaxID=1435466 RepID=A0A494YWI1_9BACI|nr:sporulation protein [Oceanobacillus bengalensis]RKQ14502.1 sporulation protein SpoOM [Oceanobacillus bengalensis]
MSLFKKTIASFGVGSAKVNTKVTNDVVKQGENLYGTVIILGGDTDQSIESIKLQLMTLYGHERSDRLTRAEVHTHRVNEPFTIKQGEKKEIPFSFEIPLDTPMTMEDPKTRLNVPPVWIETGLEIKKAFDPRDKDHISVRPTDSYQNIIDSIKMLGFRFRQMENEKTPRAIASRLPYVQQFEFVPTIGKYARKLEELEVYIVPGEKETKLYFEVDKYTGEPSGSIFDKLNLNEYRGMITLNNETIIKDIDYVCDQIEEIVDSVV